MPEISVALGIADTGLQEEVLHFLDRLPRVGIVGAAETREALRGLVRDLRPGAVVAIPDLLEDLDATAPIAIDVRETIPGLRSAIRARALGFYVWPHEREALGRDLSRLGIDEATERDERGKVVAVVGARGGAGATFLATNLAAAMAHAGAGTVLADLDPLYGDVAPALGISADSVLPSITELVPVSGEITEEHLDRVLHSHPSGIRVLLAPSSVSENSRLDAKSVTGIVGALRSRFDAVILHLPRDLNESVLAALEAADDALIVVTLDVVGIRAARRLLDRLRALGVGRHIRLVVNKVDRGEVVPEDAELVLEAPLACVIGSYRGVQRSQNRGELIFGRRGHLSRRISRLAGQLMTRRAA